MQLTTLLLLASTVTAHFRVPFPGERNSTNWSTQNVSPCGGADQVVLPRYEWNPQGSPIEITYNHQYGVGAMYFCGSGNCTTGDDFNELVYSPIDQVKGNFCIPALQMPSKYNEVNTTGVLQIIYAALGDDGGYEYMYNCVDVVISEDGPLFDGQCSNSTQPTEDFGVASIEAQSVVQLDQISTLTFLDAAKTSGSASGSASASATASMDMDMSGMSGMDMSGMSGMDMSTTLITSSTRGSGSVTTVSDSDSKSASSSASASASASSSKSTGGAIRLAVGANAIAALIALVL